MKKGEREYRFETLQVHAGQQIDVDTLSRAVPIYQTTAYMFKSAEHGAKLFALEEFGNIYTRLQNPTTDVLEKRVAALNGGVASLAVASGHSAQLVALTNIMKQGDNFVSSPYLYGGTYNQFNNTMRNMGIDCRFAKSDRAEDVEPLIDSQTKAIYVESISNSNFSVPDFEALSEVAKRHGVPLIVDNTFGACGYLCRPLAHGADIVVESATKWLGGHGNSMGGVITDGGRFDWGNGKFPMIDGPCESYHDMNMWEQFGELAFMIRARTVVLRDLGPSIAPINSWLILQGAETLSLRVEREAENSMALAEWFESHSAVESVCYPGLEHHPTHKEAVRYLQNGYGAVLSVVLKGSKEQATKFVDSLELVSHLANVGDVRTLIIQPSATTHSQLSPEALLSAGLTETTLRISPGIEHIDDLIADFEQAFEAAEF